MDQHRANPNTLRGAATRRQERQPTEVKREGHAICNQSPFIVVPDVGLFQQLVRLIIGASCGVLRPCGGYTRHDGYKGIAEGEREDDIWLQNLFHRTMRHVCRREFDSRRTSHCAEAKTKMEELLRGPETQSISQPQLLLTITALAAFHGNGRSVVDSHGAVSAVLRLIAIGLSSTDNTVAVAALGLLELLTDLQSPVFGVGSSGHLMVTNPHVYDILLSPAGVAVVGPLVQPLLTNSSESLAPPRAVLLVVARLFSVFLHRPTSSYSSGYIYKLLDDVAEPFCDAVSNDLVQRTSADKNVCTHGHPQRQHNMRVQLPDELGLEDLNGGVEVDGDDGTNVCFPSLPLDPELAQGLLAAALVTSNMFGNRREGERQLFRRVLRVDGDALAVCLMSLDTRCSSTSSQPRLISTAERLLDGIAAAKIAPGPTAAVAAAHALGKVGVSVVRKKLLALILSHLQTADQTIHHAELMEAVVESSVTANVGRGNNGEGDQERALVLAVLGALALRFPAESHDQSTVRHLVVTLVKALASWPIELQPYAAFLIVSLLSSKTAADELLCVASDSGFGRLLDEITKALLSLVISVSSEYAKTFVRTLLLQVIASVAPSLDLDDAQLLTTLLERCSFVANAAAAISLPLSSTTSTTTGGLVWPLSPEGSAVMLAVHAGDKGRMLEDGLLGLLHPAELHARALGALAAVASTHEGCLFIHGREADTSLLVSAVLQLLNVAAEGTGDLQHSAMVASAAAHALRRIGITSSTLRTPTSLAAIKRILQRTAETDTDLTAMAQSPQPPDVLGMKHVCDRLVTQQAPPRSSKGSAILSFLDNSEQVVLGDAIGGADNTSNVAAGIIATSSNMSCSLLGVCAEVLDALADAVADNEQDGSCTDGGEDDESGEQASSASNEVRALLLLDALGDRATVSGTPDSDIALLALVFTPENGVLGAPTGSCSPLSTGVSSLSSSLNRSFPSPPNKHQADHTEGKEDGEANGVQHVNGVDSQGHKVKDGENGKEDSFSYFPVASQPQPFARAVATSATQTSLLSLALLLGCLHSQSTTLSALSASPSAASQLVAVQQRLITGAAIRLVHSLLVYDSTALEGADELKALQLGVLDGDQAFGTALRATGITLARPVVHLDTVALWGISPPCLSSSDSLVQLTFGTATLQKILALCDNAAAGLEAAETSRVTSLVGMSGLPGVDVNRQQGRWQRSGEAQSATVVRVAAFLSRFPYIAVQLAEALPLVGLCTGLLTQYTASVLEDNSLVNPQSRHQAPTSPTFSTPGLGQTGGKPLAVPHVLAALVLRCASQSRAAIRLLAAADGLFPTLGATTVALFVGGTTTEISSSSPTALLVAEAIAETFHNAAVDAQNRHLIADSDTAVPALLLLSGAAVVKGGAVQATNEPTHLSSRCCLFAVRSLAALAVSRRVRAYLLANSHLAVLAALLERLVGEKESGVGSTREAEELLAQLVLLLASVIAPSDSSDTIISNVNSNTNSDTGRATPASALARVPALSRALARALFVAPAQLVPVLLPLVNTAAAASPADVAALTVGPGHIHVAGLVLGALIGLLAQPLLDLPPSAASAPVPRSHIQSMLDSHTLVPPEARAILPALRTGGTAQLGSSLKQLAALVHLADPNAALASSRYSHAAIAAAALSLAQPSMVPIQVLLVLGNILVRMAGREDTAALLVQDTVLLPVVLATVLPVQDSTSANTALLRPDDVQLLLVQLLPLLAQSPGLCSGLAAVSGVGDSLCILLNSPDHDLQLAATVALCHLTSSPEALGLLDVSDIAGALDMAAAQAVELLGLGRAVGEDLLLPLLVTATNIRRSHQPRGSRTTALASLLVSAHSAPRALVEAAQDYLRAAE